MPTSRYPRPNERILTVEQSFYVARPPSYPTDATPDTLWGGVPVHSDEARMDAELPYDLVSMSDSDGPQVDWVGQQTKETWTWLSDTLRDQAKRKALFELRGHSAQSVIDCLNQCLSHPKYRQAAEPWLLKHTVIALRKLCEVSMLYPTCYVLSGVQDICSQSGGGFCDISQGRYEGQLICLKVVRLYQKSKVEDLLRAHAREAILWSQLDHPNIVPFYGIFYLERKERICLVSPWMKNGHIVEYLERVPDAPRKSFVYDIVNGLQYLHSQNIVHGDLKGPNVLIDDHQNACLADFGLSTIVTNETLGFAKTTVSASGHTTRWASPELLEDDARHTRESDIWALGCVCYEVLTGRSPFAGCSDFKALTKLMKGELPAQLDNARLDTNGYLDEMLRELVGRCWSIEAKQRPGCLEILRQLEEVLGPQFRSSTTQRNSSHPRFRLSNSDLGDSASASTSASTSTSTSTTGMKRDRFPRNPYAEERLDMGRFFSGYDPNHNFDFSSATTSLINPPTHQATINNNSTFTNVGAESDSSLPWSYNIFSPSLSQYTDLPIPHLPFPLCTPATPEGDDSRHVPNFTVDAGYHTETREFKRTEKKKKKPKHPKPINGDGPSSPTPLQLDILQSFIRRNSGHQGTCQDTV